MRCNAVCAREVFCGDSENVRVCRGGGGGIAREGVIVFNVGVNDPPRWVVYAASLTATLLDETNRGEAEHPTYVCTHA